MRITRGYPTVRRGWGLTGWRATVALGLVFQALGACSFVGHRKPPVFDPTQNKPIVAGQSAGPGQGSFASGLLARGEPTSTCLDGWVEPAPGTPLFVSAAETFGAAAADPVRVRVFSGPGAGVSDLATWVYLQPRKGVALIASTVAGQVRVTAASGRRLPAYLVGCLEGVASTTGTPTPSH